MVVNVLKPARRDPEGRKGKGAIWDDNEGALRCHFSNSHILALTKKLLRATVSLSVPWTFSAGQSFQMGLGNAGLQGGEGYSLHRPLGRL